MNPDPETPTPVVRETAKCRGCGMLLNGKPYYMGGSAYHPRTQERCRVNFYGGFVCSPQCDFNASLNLEQSQPGHDSKQRSLGTFAQSNYNRNWK